MGALTAWPPHHQEKGEVSTVPEAVTAERSLRCASGLATSWLCWIRGKPGEVGPQCCWFLWYDKVWYGIYSGGRFLCIKFGLLSLGTAHRYSMALSLSFFLSTGVFVYDSGFFHASTVTAGIQTPTCTQCIHLLWLSELIKLSLSKSHMKKNKQKGGEGIGNIWGKHIQTNS